MKALEELPNKDKDRIRPNILFAPWTSARSLDAAVDRVCAAFKDRVFFIDIDPYYEAANVSRPAQEDFLKLKDPSNSFLRWHSFVKEIKFAIPAIQCTVNDKAVFAKQIERASALGRGMYVRLPMDVFWTEPPATLLEAISSKNMGTTFINLDACWSNDVLMQEEWTTRMVRVLRKASYSGLIVISSGNFPKDFANINGRGRIGIASRVIFKNICAKYPKLELIYGDWATTRPRERRDGGQPPHPRIDYASGNEWIIARKKDEWGFPEAAQAIYKSNDWNPKMKVWGNFFIEKTAKGDPTGIDSSPKMVAARINLHMHAQTWYNQPDELDKTDDDWEDI